MRALDHREPGILGVALTEDRIYAELICDGIHVAPQMVRLFWHTKPEDRAILITDAMSATGMPDGEYALGGIAVQVADGRATAHGVLAGSVLTQDRALANFVEYTRAPVDKVLRMLTANPATMAGLPPASLEVGEAANFVVVDGAGKLQASFIEGRAAAV
jgi:N-acetylglucosamine-6-phosphate deacetylase